jgi:hypothetical protein
MGTSSSTQTRCVGLGAYCASQLQPSAGRQPADRCLPNTSSEPGSPKANIAKISVRVAGENPQSRWYTT